MLWVRVDPHMDLPLRVVWAGRADAPRWNGMPEAMCAEQLTHDRHVGARIEAAWSLATFQTTTAIAQLASCLNDANAFYRVRTAAAAALGTMVDADTHFLALRKLIRYVKTTRYEHGHLKPNDFGDFGEYAALKAAVEAIGTCRDASGVSPPEAVALLVELLDDNDNGANVFEDGYYLGCVLRALAATRPAAQLQQEGRGHTAAIVARVTRFSGSMRRGRRTRET